MTKFLGDAVQKEANGQTAVYYIDKKRALSLLQNLGQQLPAHLSQGGSINSIRDNDSKIKPKFKNVTETTQFKRWFRNRDISGAPPSKIVDADGNPQAMFYKGARKSVSGKDLYVFSENDANSVFLPGTTETDNTKSAYLNMRRPYAETITREQYQNPRILDSIIQKAVSMGRDGAILTIKDGKMVVDRAYIVFEQKQIKSTKNIGTFFRDTDNVMYSVNDGSSAQTENSGVDADPVSAEMYGRAKSIFERLGFRVIDAINPEVDAPSNVDGYVDFKRREVYLNPEAQDPMRQVIKHEIAHILERNNTRFVRSMIRMFRTDFKAEWAKAEAKVNEVYAGLGLTERQRTSEIVAEVSLDLTTDAVILRTAQNNPDSMPKIELWWNFLKFEIRKAFGHLTGGRFGGLSTEERIELASQKWKRAYEIAQRQGGRKNLGSDVQFSIGEIEGSQGSYGIGVLLDSDIFGDADNAERKRIAKDYVVNNLAGESFVAYDGSGNPIEIALAGKNEKMVTYDGKRKSVIKELAHKNIHREIKQESVVLANELIENSKYDATKSSEYSHDWVDNYGKNDWEYRTVFLQQRDGSVWEATLNIANASDGRKILYDIDPIIKKEAGPIKSGPTTSNESVSQKISSVNSKYMQSGENDAGNDVSFAVNRGRSVSEIIADIEEVDALLDNEALSDEEYRALDRRSRKLERELAIASARGNAAEVQQNSGDVLKNAAEKTESPAKAQRKDVPASHHTDRLRESVENYRETGDSSGIPTRKSAKHSQKYYTEQMDSIMEEIKRVDAEMRSGDKKREGLPFCHGRQTRRNTWR